MKANDNKALQDPYNTELKNQKNIIKNDKNVSAAKRGRKAKQTEPEAVNLDNNPSISALPVRKRGRPKGSGGNKRPDSTVQLRKGENTLFLNHDIKLMSLPDIDINNNADVKKRISDYFRICADDDIKPSIASLALSFHVSRYTIFDWIAGKNKTIKNIECIRTLKAAYDAINSYYEHMMNNGKINPVAGIFLMKNNLGYQDTTNYIVSSGNEHTENIDNIAEKAGLLND